MGFDKEQADRLSRFLMKKVNKAIYQYRMIGDGDRIAVALSGGKDSFSLLRILQYRRQFAPEKYSVCAIRVIGDSRGRDLPPHPELEDWLKVNGIDYLIRPTFMADDEALPMDCRRCTWNRRRTLFEMAGEMQCHKVAFGHHMNDLAETALLNLMHNGKHETMGPTMDFFGGLITVIRPLIYVPERELKRFAAAHDFPPPPSPCPRDEYSQRHHVKELIAGMEKVCRGSAGRLARSALQAMHDKSSGD